MTNEIIKEAKKQGLSGVPKFVLKSNTLKNRCKFSRGDRYLSKWPL